MTHIRSVRLHRRCSTSISSSPSAAAGAASGSTTDARPRRRASRAFACWPARRCASRRRRPGSIGGWSAFCGAPSPPRRSARPTPPAFLAYLREVEIGRQIAYHRAAYRRFRRLNARLRRAAVGVAGGDGGGRRRPGARRGRRRLRRRTSPLLGAIGMALSAGAGALCRVQRPARPARRRAAGARARRASAWRCALCGARSTARRRARRWRAPRRRAPPRSCTTTSRRGIASWRSYDPVTLRRVR